jgi:23S rRNA (adenine2030-N6)-methyltransferase
MTHTAENVRMLSYRHAYHAGNHADVLKHLVLCECLAHLNGKETPYRLIDTHAGAGVYALASATAEKVAEWRDGIGRLWSLDTHGLPAAVGRYRQVIGRLNVRRELGHYPGSSWIAWSFSRPGDDVRLFERHPADFQVLAGNLDGAGGRVKVSDEDGFSGLKRLLPPPSRRGLVLIDPSYETRSDYEAVPQALAEGLRRFATGVYLIWYPRLARREARQLPEQLQAAATARPWLQAMLDVDRPSGSGHGLFGSGLFIVNPPWTLAESLAEALPWLADRLAAEGARGGYALTHSQGVS